LNRHVAGSLMLAALLNAALAKPYHS